MAQFTTWLRGLFSKRDTIQRLGSFERWLSTVPIESARAMAERAISSRWHVQPQDPGHRVELPLRDREALQLFQKFASVDAGGALISIASIAASPNWPNAFVIGDDIEHASVVLLDDGTVIVEDVDVLGGAVTPFRYPSIWHYILEVDAFTFPTVSEAAAAAAA
jgi:hypothetical protein